jgi:hypothetical protein
MGCRDGCRGRPRPGARARVPRSDRGCLPPAERPPGKPGRFPCQNSKQQGDHAERTIGETRPYLDDAKQLLRTETTAVDFFNARIERYPNHLARTDLWASARALYGVGEYSEEDVGQILVAAGLES